MQASKDENGISTLLGALNTNIETPIRICADETTHRLCVNDGENGSGENPENAPRDQNSVPVLLATSSVDGVTPVVIYASLDGKLLINRN
jgi:hypothetical protein